MIVVYFWVAVAFGYFPTLTWPDRRFCCARSGSPGDLTLIDPSSFSSGDYPGRGPRAAAIVFLAGVLSGWLQNVNIVVSNRSLYALMAVFPLPQAWQPEPIAAMPEKDILPGRQPELPSEA